MIFLHACDTLSLVLEKLMQLWQNPKVLIKIAGAIIVVLVVLSLASNLIGNTMRSLGLGDGIRLTAPSMMMGGNYAYDSDMAIEEGARVKMGVANQAMPSPMPPSEPGYSTGDDAEDYEVTEYNASIRTTDKAPVCTEFAAMKAFKHVIFEKANEHESGCSYTFKTDHTHAKDILTVIEKYDPDNLSENTYTIKRTVDYVTSEKEILEEKLASINQTLEEALNAYDEITRIATNTRDAESLATIIDSKVRLIERLTQERININEQLNRLERNMQNQLERLDYTYFYISVHEDKYVNFDSIKDSWKNAVQSFVRDVNSIAQAATIGVIGFVLSLVQYVLYFFVLLYTAKFCWKHAKSVWMK